MKALITGITGQDGSYLAELLLYKGYEVHGIIRRSSSFNTGRIDHLFNKLNLHYGDLGDSGCLTNLIHTIKPDEVYNLAAQSHVKVSFDIPEYSFDIDATGTLRLLEAVRKCSRTIKFYQASSSEIFGASPPPQSEYTPFDPVSPYAVAKLASYYNVINYRQAYDLFACNGILFNHESPRRGETFVTRKITRAVAKIIVGKQDKLVLGNLYAERDWGFAPDYVEAMYVMMQHEYPSDFVIGTGEKHTVAEFVNKAFEYAGLDPRVEIDGKYYRPNEVDSLQADYTRAKFELGWEPKMLFSDLVRIMVDADLIAEGAIIPINNFYIEDVKRFYSWLQKL